jgi:DNA-binding NtrC family response regulator
MGQKKKALVIDDEKIVLDSVKKILEETYEVESTLSGRQGLEWAVQKDYDVVLTDIRMPDIGGMLVLRDIKRAKPMMPVMIITGYASVNSAVQAMKLGAADYIEKPFTPDDLLKAVELAIEKRLPGRRMSKPWFTRRRSSGCLSGRRRTGNSLQPAPPLGGCPGGVRPEQCGKTGPSHRGHGVDRKHIRAPDGQAKKMAGKTPQPGRC